MKSDSPEVRSLVQAIAIKIVLLPVEMDSKGIGAALYGSLHILHIFLIYFFTAPDSPLTCEYYDKVCIVCRLIRLKCERF